MTYLEALKGKLNYPLSENAFLLALKDRGLYEGLDYVKCTAFDLAYADVIMILVTTPNVSEGGYSISLTEKEKLIAIAEGIYTTNNIASPIKKPTATFVQRW